MSREQDMELVGLALEHDRHFIYFLKGWMSNHHHEEMAKCARADLEGTEEGREILKEFDTTLDKTLETEV